MILTFSSTLCPLSYTDSKSLQSPKDLTYPDV
jgi:hypothetical protein